MTKQPDFTSEEIGALAEAAERSIVFLERDGNEAPTPLISAWLKLVRSAALAELRARPRVLFPLGDEWTL